jgi:hypothetical protein
MDAFLASTRVCRAAQLPCDAAEWCTGLSRDCPPDDLKEVGEPCRPSQGACDSVELCDGVSAQCPIDVSVADGAPCRSTLTPSCDGGGKCAAGTCSAKSTCACARDAECDDKNPCTDDVCQARRCVYTDRPVRSTCDDRNNCTTSDVCSASGFCVGVFAPCRNACSRRGVCCGGKCACDATRTGSACELFLNGTLAEVLPPGADSSSNATEQNNGETMTITTLQSTATGAEPWVVGVVVGVLLFAALAGLVVFYLFKRLRVRVQSQPKVALSATELKQPTRSDYGQLPFPASSNYAATAADFKFGMSQDPTYSQVSVSE